MSAFAVDTEAGKHVNLETNNKTWYQKNIYTDAGLKYNITLAASCLPEEKLELK